MDNTADVYNTIDIEDVGDIVVDELVPLVEHQWTEEEIAALEEAGLTFRDRAGRVPAA